MHLLMLLATVCWSANIIAGKDALTAMSSVAVAHLRVLAPAIVYAVAFLLTGRWRRLAWTRRSLLLVVLSAASIAVNQLGFIGGMSRSTVAHTGLIVAIGPVLVLAIAVILRLETLTPGKVAGVAIAFAGMGLLTSDKLGNGSSGLWLGDLMLLGSTLAFAFYTIFVKEVADQYDALSLNTLIFVPAALMMSPFCAHSLAVTNWGGLGLQAWGGLGFLIVLGTVLPFLLYSYVMTELSASRAAAFNYLQPLIAIALGFWLLAEPLTSRVLIGGPLILGGVYLAERERGEEKAARS